MTSQSNSNTLYFPSLTREGRQYPITIWHSEPVHAIIEPYARYNNDAH
jgi:hypothetical protein